MTGLKKLPTVESFTLSVQAVLVRLGLSVGLLLLAILLASRFNQL